MFSFCFIFLLNRTYVVFLLTVKNLMEGWRNDLFDNGSNLENKLITLKPTCEGKYMLKY